MGILSNTNMATINKSITELRRKAALPASQMGGGNVAAFFEANKGSIAALLPKTMTPDRLMKISLHTIRTTPALKECTVNSLMGAVIQCATLGLEPNTVLGHAYLVPFNKKDRFDDGRETWRKEVQIIIGYRGLIELARRSGQIVSLVAHEVHENDHFDLMYGLDEKLEHRPSLNERGDIVGFYAVAKLKDGGHCFEFMSLVQVMKIMESSQRKGKHEAWKEHFVEMGRKTVIRRLAKYLPLSIEFNTASALDSLAEAGKNQQLETVLDGDFLLMSEDSPFENKIDVATGEIQATPEDAQSTIADVQL
jgi:recombination protein RecT